MNVGENRLYLKNIRSFMIENSLSNFIQNTEIILKKIHWENELCTTQNFFIDMCYRSYDVLVAVETLQMVGLNQNEVEHPIGILLRSSLYDFINFQFIANSAIEGVNINKNLFHEMVKEHISAHFNNLPTNFELKDDLKSMDRFSEFGKKQKFKTLGILKEGKEFAKSKKINYLQEAIAIWEWYSKYEHYGAFTRLMYQKQEENVERKNTAIQLVMANIHLCFVTSCDFGNEFIKLEELDPMGEIILNFKPKANTH